MSHIQELFLALADEAHASGRDFITVTEVEVYEYANAYGENIRPLLAAKGNLECLGMRVVIAPQETE